MTQEKKLTGEDQNIKNVKRLVDSMKTILDDSMKTILDEQLIKIPGLDIDNLQYETIPFKYIEVCIEVYQILLTYELNPGLDSALIWWDRTKYGDSLEFYDSKFIDLAGKIRYEGEYIDSIKVRNSHIPRKTVSSEYGLKRTLIKKNTTEIKDASEDIFKEKENIRKTVKNYLIELNGEVCIGFRDRIRSLKGKTENIEEEGAGSDGYHRIPENGVFVKKSKRKR